MLRQPRGGLPEVRTAFVRGFRGTAQERHIYAPEALDSTILEQPVDEEEENIVEDLDKAMSNIFLPR
jgi:hypothetical protein